ncbi:MAG: hypothetical protein HYZ14_05450, partial [Bacteroidetes bacterium]|nr:hypothetical protein [Bacteroidota bacterium]
MKQIEKGLQIVCAWVALHGTQTFAQDLFYQWGLGFADMNYVEQGGELDAAGNLITFSCYNGTHDMDPTAGGDVITPAGSYDFFLAKYDPDGLLLWSHGFGAPPNEIVGDVTTDSDLNIYITGHIQGGPVDFNPAFPGTTVLSSSGLFDSFIAKYNPDGELIWIKIIGNPTSNDKALFIDIDDNLNVYISGLFMGTTDFDPSLSNTSLSSTPGFNDVFVAKYDTSGNFVWVKQITGSEYYELNAMTIDNNNDLIVSTIYTTSSDFNPSGGGDVHTVPTDYAPTSLTKFGSDGTYLWTKDLSGNALTAWLDINDMKTDAANNIIIGAYYENNPDFDPSAGVAIFPSIPASGCFCFAKYDANGNYTYAKTFGYGSVTSLDLDAAGNIYLAGVYSLTVDFDPSTGTQSKTSNGLADLFLAKYSSVGNYEWVYTNGGTAQDVLMDVEVSPGGSIRVVGHNENPAVDFDPSPAIQTLTMETTGTIASFWARYDQCLATTATDVQTACGSYTWINGTTYTASNNTATHVLTNAEGCDSIITLNLTINPVLASSQTLSICSGESVTVGTSTYSTSGVYTDVLTAVNGCDSTVTTDLTVGAAISGSQTL